MFDPCITHHQKSLLNLHSRGFFSFSRSGAGEAGVFSIDTAGLRLPCAAMRSRGERGHRSTAQAALQPLWCAAAVWRRKGRPERGGVGNVCRPPETKSCHSMCFHATHIRRLVRPQVCAGEFSSKAAAPRHARHPQDAQTFRTLGDTGLQQNRLPFSIPILVSLFWYINLNFYRVIFHITNEALDGYTQ